MTNAYLVCTELRNTIVREFVFGSKADMNAFLVATRNDRRVRAVTPMILRLSHVRPITVTAALATI